MKRMKFTLGILSLALLSTTFFVSCNNEDEATPQQENNNITNLARGSVRYQSETQEFVKYFYNNDYKILKEETITNEDKETFIVSTIESKGIERGFLVTIVNENKVVFADKDDSSKTLTHFDLSQAEPLQKLDFSNPINENEELKTHCIGNF
nr:hypothetical protein [uncultured Flavobacterium sp.]